MVKCLFMIVVTVWNNTLLHKFFQKKENEIYLRRSRFWGNEYKTNCEYKLGFLKKNISNENAIFEKNFDISK